MTSFLSTCVRVAGGSAMVFAGVGHLSFARQAFQAQVPSWVPVDDDTTVLGSGVVEIALGAAFALVPSQKRRIGLVLASFFVAVFPGNLSQYRHRRSSLGLDTDRKRFVRLWFQPLMVLGALFGGGLIGDRERDTDPVDSITGL